jgi:hypothetical protein
VSGQTRSRCSARRSHISAAHRFHAVCFHQDTTGPGQAGVIRGDRALLEKIVQDQLSPVGRLQVNTALAVMEALDEHVDRLRRRLLATARQVHGARVLMHEIYGVGDDLPGVARLAGRAGPVQLLPALRPLGGMSVKAINDIGAVIQRSANSREVRRGQAHHARTTACDCGQR